MEKKEIIAKKIDEKVYEVGYHLISSIAEENVPGEVEKIKEILAKENSVIISEENPKLRPLTYTIKKAFGGTYKKFDKAYFGFIKFALTEGGDITKIDSFMKSNESVLRYLVIKTVRENTMFYPKSLSFVAKEVKFKLEKSEKAEKAEKAEKEKTEVKPASVEDIDKSIDDLVSEGV
ncbi:MAG: 30S ribosomal protein S6 [Minisyncoccia bacterium]